MVYHKLGLVVLCFSNQIRVTNVIQLLHNYNHFFSTLDTLLFLLCFSNDGNATFQQVVELIFGISCFGEPSAENISN